MDGVRIRTPVVQIRTRMDSHMLRGHLVIFSTIFPRAHKKQKVIPNNDLKYINGNNICNVLADDIETGLGNRIPLWLLGFVY